MGYKGTSDILSATLETRDRLLQYIPGLLSYPWSRSKLSMGQVRKRCIIVQRAGDLCISIKI